MLAIASSSTVLLNKELSLLNFNVFNSSCNFGIVPCFKIAANSYTPYYGIVVSVADDEDLIDKPTLAKVANGILDVKEIKACFVIGRVSKESIGISARSDGSVNVQKIMESLEGGGHFSAAATELRDITVEEAKKMLASKMEGFIGDTRITE